jgi:hypothetical protein
LYNCDDEYDNSATTCFANFTMSSLSNNTYLDARQVGQDVHLIAHGSHILLLHKHENNFTPSTRSAMQMRQDKIGRSDFATIVVPSIKLVNGTHGL